MPSKRLHNQRLQGRETMISLHCPRCGKTELFNGSPEELLKTTDELWKPFLQFLTPAQSLRLEQTNNIESWKRIIEEKGELKMLCKQCRIRFSIIGVFLAESGVITT